MNRSMSLMKKMVITAMCITLCTVLPMLFHIIPALASGFSPMHIPVFICGLVCGPVFGLVCGIMGPIISGLTTGMPGAAYLPSMVVELAFYGLIAGLGMYFIRTKRLMADLYISLLIAMIIGRVAAGIARALFFTPGASYSIALWVNSYLIGTLPGIVAHLVFIPPIIIALEKAQLIPQRYPTRVWR